MNPNNSQKTLEDDLLDKFAGGMEPKELTVETQKLKAELQKIKEAALNQFGRTSMIQMGMQIDEMKKEIDGLKAEVWKMNEENAGLKRKLAKIEEEFAGKKAKLNDMEKEMNKIGAKNTELEGQIVEKNEEMGKIKAERNEEKNDDLERKIHELQDQQKADKQALANLTGSIDGMEFLELYQDQMKNNKWDEADCGPQLDISEEGLVVEFSGTEVWNCVRAILPISSANLNVMTPSIAGYFEVQIVRKWFWGIGIGFCCQQFPLEGGLLGEKENSIVIDDNDGMFINGKSKVFENAHDCFKEEDVVGAGIIHFPANSSMKCFATLNGELLGKFELPNDFANIQLYPAVSISTRHETIRANFGQKIWRFNPNQLLQ